MAMLSLIVYRCMVCGRVVTASDLRGVQPWERGKRTYWEPWGFC